MSEPRTRRRGPGEDLLQEAQEQKHRLNQQASALLQSSDFTVDGVRELVRLATEFMDLADGRLKEASRRMNQAKTVIHRATACDYN